MKTHMLIDGVSTVPIMSQENGLNDFAMQDLGDAPAVGWNAFINGWSGLADLGVLIPMAASVLTAVLLAFPIAYHPRVYRRATTLDEVEAPKGIVGYAAVSAGIAQVVAVSNVMAFALFGIGSLYRFRTRAGQPKVMYHMIAVVVIGLACGMMMFPLAVVLAALTWALPFWSESRYAVALQVKDLSKDGTGAAVTRCRKVLEEHGGQVVCVRTERTGQFSIVANIPARVNPAEVEAKLRELPTEESGKVHWETR